MRLDSYPLYKQSGISWYEDIPQGWDVKPLFALANECSLSNKGMIEDNLLSLSYGNVINKNINSNDGLLPESFETYQVVEPDDIVLRLTDLQNDKRSLRSAIVKERGIITSAYLAIRPTNIDPTFLNYLLRAYDLTKVFYSMGGGLRQSMKFSDVKRLPLILPSVVEQKSITLFLDGETAKIDALIAAQEKLIDLLKEKRQAVISHAVTKGIDPKVKMKDSGVEWLGEIPEHWDVRKGAAIGSLFGSEQISEEDISEIGEFPYLKVGSLSTDSFEIANWDWFISKKGSEKIRLRKNYIIFPKRGAAIFLNKVNIVDKLSAIDPNLMGWVIFEIAHPKFIGFVLKTRKLEQLADVSTVPQINNKHISPELFPLPPLSEQIKIVNFIEYELLKISSLLSTAEMVIKLLQERRSALISAAVTGQIDVRNYQPKEIA